MSPSTALRCGEVPPPPSAVTVSVSPQPLAGGSKVEAELGASVASALVTEELLCIQSPAEGHVPLVTQAKAG